MLKIIMINVTMRSTKTKQNKTIDGTKFKKKKYKKIQKPLNKIKS